MSLPRLAVLCDPLDEGWRSMDLVADMTVAALSDTCSDRLRVTAFRPPLHALARRLPVLPPRLALNADRVLTRFFSYPGRLPFLWRAFDLFHVADHSYAQLIHALPPARTGVFCHDLDAFGSLLEDGRPSRPGWFRAMARAQLLGLQRAAVVFYSTAQIREQIARHGLLREERLVHAPYGVAPEFSPEPSPHDGSAAVLAPLAGRPFLLHVGNALPRKRLDVLLDVAARLRTQRPELALVQVGAQLPDALRARAERPDLAGALLQPPKLDRWTLAGLYRAAAAVLQPSEAEGFGLPVLEALACGAAVVASDIPSLREVGGDAVRYCPVGDVGAWVDATGPLLDSRPPGTRERALAQAGRFSWARHAEILATAYSALAPRRSAG